MKRLRRIGIFAMTILLLSMAVNGYAYTFYVDDDSPILDDEEGGPLRATDPNKPWRTIERAMQVMAPGDRVIVRPGVYAETVEPRVGDITIMADNSTGRVIVSPPSGENGFDLDGTSGVTIDGFRVTGGGTGIKIINGAAGTLIRNNIVFLNGSDGIGVKDSNGVVIEDSIVYSNGGKGIGVKDSSSNAKIVNNLIYNNGDTEENGISVVGGSGHIIRNNTVYKHQTGIFVANAPATITNNIVVDCTSHGISVNDTNLANYEVDYNDIYDTFDEAINPWPVAGNNNLGLDPLFSDPDGADNILGEAKGMDDRFYLDPDSPCIDAGSDTAENLGLDGYNARSDIPYDYGIVDLGFHYPIYMISGQIDIKEAFINLISSAPNKDSFIIRFNFSLPAGSNGVDPLFDYIIVRVGSYEELIPSGLFKKKGNRYIYNAGKGRVQRFLLNPNSGWGNVKATNIDLSGSELLPVNIEFVLRDDVLSTEINADVKMTYFR